MRTAAVLTISDSSSRGERADVSGPAIAGLLRQNEFQVEHNEIVPDDQPAIEAALVRLSEQAELIVTTGGTGIAERDVTPEATRAVCNKLIDGIPEKMRSAGAAQTPLAALSRGLCGVRGRTLIVNVPGSPEGAVQSLHSVVDILPHALDLLAGKTGHE
ncbi:MAG TPA: MogA/MoaB family molybdenum cofactor biosynthesis protein [Candidatus Binatia bacterium]|nr:MogA/MoaB family molybdenum cofactor biosynthesis protein [Candidatus Binatia bacterium]